MRPLARRNDRQVPGAVILLLCASACSSTYVARIQPGLDSFRGGDMSGARQFFESERQSAKAERHLLGLEAATSCLAMDDLVAARTSYQAAIDEMDTIRGSDPMADVAALLLDDTKRPYPGAPFEQVMARVCWAFAYLLSGEQQRMENVAAAFREIDNKMESIEAYYKRAYPFDESGSASEFNFQIPPLGKYLAGLMAQQRGELDSARIYLRQARDGLPGSRLLATEEQRMQQGSRDHRLIVCAMVGMAPRKVAVQSPELTGALQGLKAVYFALNPQQDVDPFLNAELTVPVLVPDLEPPRPRWHGGFVVQPTGGAGAHTECLADVDAYARQEFDMLRSGIFLRAALRRLIKEAIGQAGAAQAGWSAEAGSAISSLLSAAETTDLRSWYTLPREVHVASMSLPDGCRSITVTPQRAGGGDAGPPIEVSIDASNPELAFVLIFQPSQSVAPIVLVDEAHLSQ